MFSVPASWAPSPPVASGVGSPGLAMDASGPQPPAHHCLWLQGCRLPPPVSAEAAGRFFDARPLPGCFCSRCPRCPPDQPSASSWEGTSEALRGDGPPLEQGSHESVVTNTAGGGSSLSASAPPALFTASLPDFSLGYAARKRVQGPLKLSVS